MSDSKEDRVSRLSDAFVIRVRTVFDDVAMPEEIISTEDTGYEERDQVAKMFAGRRWQDVTTADVHQFASSLSCLTPEAFRYYFPAFVLAVVDLWRTSSAAPDYLVLNLTPNLYNGSKLWALSELLSESQAKIILDFVIWAKNAGCGLEEDLQMAVEVWEEIVTKKE